MHMNHKHPCTFENFGDYGTPERNAARDFLDSISKSALFDIAWHLANRCTGSGVDSGTALEVLSTMKKELHVLQAQELANKTAWKPSASDLASWG